MPSAAAYRALIDRLEVQARENPSAYRLRLALLAALGYAVLGASIAFALAISAGVALGLLLTKNWVLIAKLAKFALLPLGLAWLILRALLVRIEPPQGYALRPGEAPELEAEVERLRRHTGAPPLSGIVIDDQLNAAAASVPRLLGLLGSRHYLVLGLPLMQLLDRDELGAVVAHEFGHFGRGHGRFSGWIYRLRQSWFRVLDALQARGGWASGVYSRFFNWYAPYFNAYSFVLARANEYEADAVAREVVGADTAGSALMRLEVGVRRLDREFWPALDRSTDVVPQPPAMLYRDMGRSLASDGPADGDWIQDALACQPGLDDTHPVLRQRLEALGVVPSLQRLRGRTAAETLLGDLGPALETRFSDEWRGWIAETWQQRHEAGRNARERMQVLDAARTERGLQAEELVEYALLVDERHPEGEAEPLLREALAVQPAHAVLNFRLGTLLLQRADAAGVGHLRRAMEADDEVAEPALRHLAAFHGQRGETDAEDAVSGELQALYARYERAHAERQVLRRKDPLQPHGLDAGQLQAVVDSLRAFGKVGRAWLVRKPVDGDGALPHHVIVVKWRAFVFSDQSSLDALVEQVQLPGTFLALSASGGEGALVRRVKKVPGAEIALR